MSTRSLTERIEKSGNKQINNNKEVTISAYKNKKVAMTTTDIKLVGKKLLTASAKETEKKDLRDISMRKVWI